MESLTFVVSKLNGAAINDADRDIQGWVAELNELGIDAEYTQGVTDTGTKQHNLQISYGTFRAVVSARSTNKVASFGLTKLSFNGASYNARTTGRNKIDVYNASGSLVDVDQPVYDAVRVLHNRVIQEFI